ncbi:MAG: radical SAM protein [Candidatus Omnitrophica bacterium]|nr:radical SAM protein [Candidatus Omnitrophota bacterium]
MMYKRLRKLLYFRKMFLGYYFLKDGYSFPPTQLALLPTMRCNLRCKMCAQWGEQGHFKTEAVSGLKSEELRFEQWKKIIDETCPKRIIIWGGEPFLYPKIMQLISYIKSKDLRCLVITNGTLLSPYACEVVRTRLDEIEISLDGPREVNDKIRNAGAYDKTIESIRALVKARDQKKTRYPKIIINTVITEDSYNTLEKMVELSKTLRIDGIHFIYGWNIPLHMGRRYEEVCSKLFGIEAASWRGFRKEEINMNLKRLSGIIKNIQTKRNEGLHITFLPELSPAEIANFYNNTSKMSQKKCFSLWARADIRYNGDIVFCGDFPDYVLGNVKKDSFLAIWNGKKAREFRKKIKEVNLLPVCSRCCNLYQYNA